MDFNVKKGNVSTACLAAIVEKYTAVLPRIASVKSWGRLLSVMRSPIRSYIFTEHQRVRYLKDQGHSRSTNISHSCQILAGGIIEKNNFSY
jgi:hypothetical protein